jgi:hypothetical protein
VRRNHFVISIIVLLSLLAAMSGCVISPRRIVGGGGSPTPTPSGSPTPTPNPTVTGKLYVTNQNGNSILRFDNAFTTTGNAAPNATISGANTGLSGPQFMTIDTAADRLFVANASGSSVLIWDAISTRNGNIAPTRTLAGVNTGFVTPSDVALDKTHDLLYVADGPEVFVFTSASTANGDQTPVRDIIVSGFNIAGMLLDTANDRLYLSDGATSAINVYDSASTLNGTIATANRQMAGANTKLASPSGMTFDAFANLVVSNQGNGSITVYANPGTANGNVTPIVTIAGTATTLLSPGQIIRNTASSTNDVIVADATANEVAVFSSVNSQGGNVAPSRKISGPATTLTGVSARGVALDPTR